MQKASSATIRTVQEAVFSRDVKKVRQLLNNCENEQMIRSALCSAVTLDDTSMLQSILDQVKHSNVSDNLYQQKHLQFDLSPMHSSCSRDNTESLSLLLKAGFTANVVDDVRQTPLHFACVTGNRDSARSLLSYGADVNARDEFRQTPLYDACSLGYTDIVEVLLQSGAKINHKGDEETDIGFSYMFTPPEELRKKHRYAADPLLAAIQRRHPKVFSSLILHGANIDIKLYNNVTALHVACSKGTLDMVKTLVNNGSCINAETYSGQTPLFYCLRSVPRHADSRVYPIYRDGIGCGCCYISHSLASYEDNIQEGNDIMEYLIKQGATLSCKDDSGRTPLEYSMMTYRTLSTFILLKYGGQISGEHLDTFPWNLHSCDGDIQDQIPNVHLFRLLLRSNFEFRKFLPVYLGKLRDLKSTESFLSFLKEVEQPLSLKNQCRISIRNMISTDTGVQFIRSIDTIGLPKLLQGFLVFDDYDQSVRLPAEFRLQK